MNGGNTMSTKIYLALAATAMALTACVAPSAAPQATVTATVTEEAPEATPVDPSPQGGSSADDDYIMLLASEGIIADRDTLIELGGSICEALDNGFDHAVLVMVAVDSGLTEEEGAALVAAAVVAYCPEHSLSS